MFKYMLYVYVWGDDIKKCHLIDCQSQYEHIYLSLGLIFHMFILMTRVKGRI